MTIPMANTSTPPRRLGRSVAAVLLGFVAVVVLSLGTDQLLHVLQVYPIAMWDFGPNWYPVALVLTTLPWAWLGGVLHQAQR